MAWTYGAGPANSTRDAVRLFLGDTDSTDQQLSDSEINYFISLFPTTYAAAAMAARAVAAKYARLVSKSVGDLRIEYQQRQASYAAIAVRLDEQAGAAGASPYLGGLTLADKESNSENTALVQPDFIRDQFDNEDSTEDLTSE